jgi:argininosuccinate lyase
VFDAADTLELVLPALVGAIRTIRFDSDRMRAACEDEGLYATDLAEALVRSGVPFREAHRRTGELLRRLDAEGGSLRQMAEEAWGEFGVPDGASLLDPDRSVRSRTTSGGPSPDSVRAQADAIEALLASRDISP